MMLKTARLTLRRARMEDAADLFAVFSQPQAMRYWSTPAHTDLAQTRAFLATMVAAPAEQACDFVLEYQGRVVGKAGCWQFPEVGYILHPDLWGIGLAHEALTAVIDHLFAHHALPRLTADVDPRNTPSRKLLERLGFQETGTKAKTLLWGDEWCDSVYYALDRANWSPQGQSRS
jgi:[ribosomal protein S5]-alanine N-acetyltransferase